MTRREEIQAIWRQYQGLYVVAGVLIGLLIFPFLELLINDLSELLLGLVPEAIGIVFTVLIIDQLNQQREDRRRIEDLKQRLIHKAGSSSNDTAIKAIEDLREHGWLEGENGLLKGISLVDTNLTKAPLTRANLQEADLWDVKLIEANLQNANLTNAKLVGISMKKAQLGHANLSGAKLEITNLSEANLSEANLSNARLHAINLSKTGSSYLNLSGTFLMEANLTRAYLNRANLKGAYLVKANLKGAYLMESDLSGAYLKEANLEGVSWEAMGLDNKIITSILPDGTSWRKDINLEKFTNPDHDEYQPTLEVINDQRRKMGVKIFDPNDHTAWE